MPLDDPGQAAKDLASAATRLADAAYEGTHAAADPVAASIRDQASFSDRILSAIRVGHYTTGAVVYVDPDVAPHAAALNNAGEGGTFLHPVFGNEWMAEQQAMPFFEPGAYAASDDVDAAMDAALTKWERSAGFQ